jgi:putative glycerol-1-phosphate prenyltransferase
VTANSTYDRIVEAASKHGASFAVLIDPEKQTADTLADLTANCAAAGVDLLLLGGSSGQDVDFERYTEKLQSVTDLPVIGFPGALGQISRSLDAVLYLSLVSGRNPDFLIGRHVQAAPRIRSLGVEAIATAYLLIESGETTAVQRVTGTDPIPRDAERLAADTALAGEMMGMRLIYLEAGSGASTPVPTAMVEAVAAQCDAPVMVGGGLRTPEEVADRAAAGARFVVMGNAIEQRRDRGYLSELVSAAHVR